MAQLTALWLWQVVVLAPAATVCPASEFQAEPLVLSCSPGNGSIRLELVETLGRSLGSIPAGYDHLELQLASASSNSMHLQLLDAQGNCVVGYGCDINASCSDGMDFCHQLDGIALSYVSQPFLTVGVQELLRFASGSPLLRPLSAWVRLERRSASVAVGLVDYGHQGTQDCPKPLPGCRRCRDFEGCLPGQTAVCLGDGQIPSCSNEPALPEKQDWFELRLGGTTATTNSCSCCQWPLAEPVKIGMAWAMNSNGPSDAEAFAVISTLQHFLRWFNQQRGGLCSNGQRRPVELLVLDTQGLPDLYPSALQRLAYDHNISLFLGPLEGESMADLAQRLNLLILSPVLTSRDRMRRCRFCFSLHPPPQKLLPPALALLETTASDWRVVYLQDDDAVSAESCGMLPNLTRWEVTEWSVDLDHLSIASLPATGTSDVWVLCTQTFKHCLNFVEFWSTLTASQSPKAVVMSGPCASILQSVPNYGGFLLGASPLNLWASWTSNGVDGLWSTSGTKPQDLLPWLASLVEGADSNEVLLQVPSGRVHDNATAWSFQRQAEISTLRMGRPVAPFTAWAALSALLTAVERTGQATPEAVSSFFRGLKEGDLDTIVGPVVFDEDGALAHGGWLLQQLPQDATPKLHAFAWEGGVCTMASGCEVSQRLQNSSVLQTWEDRVLPLPLWAERRCFQSGSSTWGFEVLPHGSFCEECVSSKVSTFEPSLHQRFCRSCAATEYVFDWQNGTRLCLTCPGGASTCAAGLYTLNCQCQECDAGTYGQNGTCHPCPLGHISSAGAQQCEPCPAGHSSSGTACVPCSPGTFAATAGSSCLYCPPGSAAPVAGRSACEVCPEGHRSSWDGVSCQACPQGTYQPKTNASECLMAVEGADFNGEGLVTGTNLPGYWTRHMNLEVTWEACVAPEQCLRNETCSTGTAGVQCFSCLPDYVRGAGSTSCQQCNSLEAALGLASFVLLVVFFAVTLAKLGLARRNRPRDLRVVYIKIFLFYLVVADALLETALQALRLRPTVSFLSSFLVSAVSPQLLRWARCAGDAALRGLGAPGSSVADVAGRAVSRELVQSLWPGSAEQLFDASWQELSSSLEAMGHGSWFLPETRQLHEQLKSYQFAVELFSLSFWFSLPLVLWLLLYLGALCYVRLRVCLDRGFHRSCLRFYEELVKDGTRETLACYDAEDWLSFCKAYFQSTCYLWSSLELFEAGDLGGCRSFLKSFSQQARPLLVALLLVIYAPVLMGLVEPFRCIQLGEESVARSFYAPEIRCGLETTYQWINLSLALLWAMGVPCLLSNLLRKVRNSLPDDFEFPPEYAVISFGYRLGCWNWEMYIFFLKALIIASALLGPAARSSFLFFLAILHGVLTRGITPFTGRSHFALVKWDQRFALYFLVNSILVQGLHFSSEVEVVNQILAAGEVVLFLLLNLLLLLLLLRDCFNCWHETFVESYEFYEWELWHQARSRFGPISRLVLLLLNQYKRRVRSRAYVSFDVRLGWLTICGSHGDQARCTLNWHDDGVPCDLSKAPLRWPDHVRPSTAQQRIWVQKYLQKAAERLCLIRGCPSFSVVELEFLIRGAYVFARREELRRQRLTRQRQVISQEESFLGLDALQLLWNSLEETGEEEGATGRGSTFARRSARRSSRSSGSSSVSSGVEPLAESVRKRFKSHLICESFFSDPGKVLFFYSRAEFIRQAETKKLKGADQNRMSTIPMERTPVLTLCCKLLGRIRTACRSLCCRSSSMSLAAERSNTFRGSGGRGMKSQVVRGLDQVDPIIQEMFDDETFSRGLELQEFQMGLIMVEHRKDSELKALQDAFHDRWFQHRLVVEHQMRKLQGTLKDQCVQADADEDMSEQLAQESLQARMTDEDRPTVEDLRWMRLVMKAGGGLFKEKVMPSLAEINQLLRERWNQGDMSSRASSEMANNGPSGHG